MSDGHTSSVFVVPTSPPLSRPESLYGGESIGNLTQTPEGDSLETSIHLQLLFQYYCRFGRSGTDHDIETLDNAMYAKFTRDCPGLLQRPLTVAEADLLFSRMKTKALRRITYVQVSCVISSHVLHSTFFGANPHIHTRTTPRSGWTFSRLWQP